METLMIHDIHRKYFELNLSQYRLTFDHFMTIEELQAISGRTNVKIGVHSHFHDVIFSRTHPRKRKPLAKWKFKCRFNEDRVTPKSVD